jgi:hypothetical protein
LSSTITILSRVCQNIAHCLKLKVLHFSDTFFF